MSWIFTVRRFSAFLSFVFFYFLETAGLARKTNETPTLPPGSHDFLPWFVPALFVHE